MRKVLLATTALVAMGGVSAASADISISGSATWMYQTTSGTGTGPTAAESTNFDTAQTDANISMSSTLDNGMSLSGLVSLDETGVDDAGWSISGDFGKLGFGGGGANDGFGTTATGLTADEGNTFTAGRFTTVHNDYIDHSDVSLTLPAVSGVTFAIGLSDGDTAGANEDDGNGTQWGVTYSVPAGSMGVTVAYAHGSTGAANTDETSAGVTVTAGDAKVVLAQNTSGDLEADSIGVSYKVSDALTVQAYTGTAENDANANYEVKDTAYGLTYTITAGLSMSITHNDFEAENGTAAQDESGNRTVVALDVTF